MTDSKVKVKRFGLTEVYTSPEKPPLVDIVFVHGLNGDPEKTWTNKSSGTFWPAKLLPDVASRRRVRILTYGYNADVLSFTDGTSKDHLHHHAERLAAELVAKRSLGDCLDRPIIFVCHSLGGLVVKRALIATRNVANEKTEHLRSIFVSTYGILFLGTPHNGADVAKWGLLLQNICSAVLPRRFLDTSTQLVEGLKVNNENLQSINRLFTEIVSRFHIYFFHETRPTDLRGARVLIVDEASAAPNHEGVERMGIEADHNGMCKFEDENAPGYEAVAEAIVRYSRDAPPTITGRWVEEKRRRQVELQAKAFEIFPAIMPTPTSVPEVGVSENPDRLGASIGSLPPHTSGDNSPVSQMSQSVNASISRPFQRPLFVVPPGFHPNEHFFGMEKELSELHLRLFGGKRAERVMAVLICGGPGSGKTHLARQYVHLHRGDYPGGIFWVDAKSFQSVCKCFGDIVEAGPLADGYEIKRPESHVAAVRKWFETREEWLLVFDGISFDGDEEINEFMQFLPFSKNSSIIYTSVDQTLKGKTRLFEPSCLFVLPLEVDDARKLLFKELEIEKPTPEQMQKGTELVQHYQCLPLAIHAISHRLSATAKPIEKYHINSHLTDKRLKEPFLGIMLDLLRREYFAALNLINLVSFFGHHVPLGMIQLGKGALSEWNVNILSNSEPGEREDLDTTLGVLIRYGLIDRVAAYVTNRKIKSLLGNNVKKQQSSPELSESQTERAYHSVFPEVYQSSIEVLKIHSVVQGFCRDELTIMDAEQRSEPRNKDGRSESTDQDAGHFDSWLVVATYVLCRSYENAKRRSKSTKKLPLVQDYREYETHSERLMGFYPKKHQSHPLRIVHEAHHLLTQTIKDIKKEIDDASPNSSQETIRLDKSIFDHSSSSSEPSSSVDEGISRQSTWGQADPETAQQESPQSMVSPHRVRLSPFIPHIYREFSDREPGYETDGENEKAKKPDNSDRKTASTPPRTGLSSQDRRSRPQRRPRRDLDEWRVPAPAELSRTQGEGSISKPQDRNAPSLDATALLTAVHHSSPPPSRGGAIKNIGRSKPKGSENPIYASVLMSGSRPPAPVSESGVTSPPVGSTSPSLTLELKPCSSQESLGSQSSYDDHSLSVDSRHKHFSALAHSDPGIVHRKISGSSDPRSPLSSRIHSRNPSVARSDNIERDRSLDALASINQSLFEEQPSTNSMSKRLTSPHRSADATQRAQVAQGTQSITSLHHPSAIMPGVASSPPSSYMSEPMSRNPSGQSHNSWHADLRDYSSSYSHSLAMDHQGKGRPENVRPPNPSGDRMSNIDISQVFRGRTGPEPLWRQYENEDEQMIMLFGGHEVDVHEARRRLWEHAQVSPEHDPISLLSPNMGLDSSQGKSLNRRQRGRSTPPRPNLNGLGLLQ